MVEASQQSQNVSSLVAGEIEFLINSGELVGGDRINESALAQKLGVSRAPIREACRALEQAGLVRNVVNRGFLVQEISIKEALDIYEIRAGLFRTAGRLLGERITRDQIKSLRSLVNDMDTAAQQDAFSKFYELNETFHRKILECCDNDRLLKIWHQLQTQLNLFRRRAIVVRGAMHGANSEHLSIVDAFESGDSTAIALLSERHILSGKARLLSTLTETGIGTRKGKKVNDLNKIKEIKK